MGFKVFPVLAAERDVGEESLAVKPEEFLLHGRYVLVCEENLVCHDEAAAALRYLATSFIPFSALYDPDASDHSTVYFR